MSLAGWLFGGVGGAVVAAFIGVLFARSRKSVSQEQRVSGSHSTTIQAGRDVFVGQAQADKEFAVQPIMDLSLGYPERGPEGHYLHGTVKNIGRGIARNPKIFGPGLDDVRLKTLIGVSEPPVKLRVRYDNSPAFLHVLDDPTVRVVFENEMGVEYEQIGTITQTKDPRGAFYDYSITGLGPVAKRKP